MDDKDPSEVIGMAFLEWCPAYEEWATRPDRAISDRCTLCGARHYLTIWEAAHIAYLIMSAI